MSTVFVIDPQTGEIMEELIAHASYRSPKGVTVKPETEAEMLRLRHISENALRIRRMQEELQALDRRLEQEALARDFADLERIRRKRRGIAEQIQQQENFAQVSQTLHRLQERTAELEEIVLSFATTQGTEEVRLHADEYIGPARLQLAHRLTRLSDAFLSDEPEAVAETARELAEIENQLEDLPRQVREAYFRTMLQLELAQNVADRLAEAGWRVMLEEGKGSRTSVCIRLENAIGDRASAVFAHDGQIRLETPGFDESTRRSLQQRILGALRDSGVVNLAARCADQSPCGSGASRAQRSEAEAERECQLL